MTTQTYFLPPDFLSYPAATDSNPGLIRLGQLISDIDDPGHTIGTLPPLDTAAYDMSINTLEATGMGHTVRSSSSFLANVFFKAVEIVGAKFDVKVQQSNKLLSAMAAIEAQTIDPKDSYVRASMEQAEVQSWLKQSWGRRPVFMVCGILIARLAADSKVDISTEASSDISGEAEACSKAAQVPLRGGANAGGTFATHFGLAFVPKTPFIYGFKLRECFFKKAQGSSRAYYKGAKMHAVGQSGGPQSAEMEELVFDFSGVAKKDLGFDTVGDAGENFTEANVADIDDTMNCSLVARKIR